MFVRSLMSRKPVQSTSGALRKLALSRRERNFPTQENSIEGHFLWDNIGATAAVQEKVWAGETVRVVRNQSLITGNWGLPPVRLASFLNAAVSLQTATVATIVAYRLFHFRCEPLSFSLQLASGLALCRGYNKSWAKEGSFVRCHSSFVRVCPTPRSVFRLT